MKNQQYGGTFGGPIKKDKAFFFGYFEGQRLAVTSPYDVHVPTTAQIAAARSRIAAAGLTVNPIGEALLKYYPTDPTGTMHVGAPNVSNMSTFSVKLDHQLNANNLDLFNSVADPTRVALVGLVCHDAGAPRRSCADAARCGRPSSSIRDAGRVDDAPGPAKAGRHEVRSGSGPYFCTATPRRRSPRRSRSQERIRPLLLWRPALAGLTIESPMP